MGDSSYSTISALFSTSASLLAVSTALMIFVPGFGQQAVRGAGKFSADVERRAYRLLLLGFGAATLMFFLSTLGAIFGLLWPSDWMVFSLASVLGVGIIAMAVTAGLFAARALGEIK